MANSTKMPVSSGRVDSLDCLTKESPNVGEEVQIWVPLSARCASNSIESQPTNGTAVLVDPSNASLFKIGSSLRLESPKGQRNATIVEISQTRQGKCKLELKWEDGNSAEPSIAQVITVTKGNGIAYLEQVRDGETYKLVMTTQQFAAVTLFLSQPNSDRFHTSNKVLGAVAVQYSSADQQYSISKGDFRLTGNRKLANCGFSGVTLNSLPQDRA